jgi:hypothetical protein
VEVYDQFVMVTTQDGLSHVHPHGYYSGLMSNYPPVKML